MKEINIRGFWELLLRNLRAIVVVMAIVAAAFAAYTSVFTTDTYSSKCSMYVMNITADSAGETTGISSAGLDASQRMVNEYIAILKSTRVMSRVHDILQEQGHTISVSGVRSSLKMASVDETAMLEITATTVNPQLSRDMCDALQACAPEEVNEVMLKIGHVSPVDTAEIGSKSKPPVVRNGVFGALIGFALIYGFFLMNYLMDNTIKEEKDLKERFEVNVLGAVPSFNPDMGKSKNTKNSSKGKPYVEEKPEKVAKAETVAEEEKGGE